MWILLLLGLVVLFHYLSHCRLSPADRTSEKSLSTTSDDPIKVTSCSEKSISSTSDDHIKVTSCSEKSLSVISTSDDLSSCKYDGSSKKGTHVEQSPGKVLNIEKHLKGISTYGSSKKGFVVKHLKDISTYGSSKKGFVVKHLKGISTYGSSKKGFVGKYLKYAKSQVAENATCQLKHDVFWSVSSEDTHNNNFTSHLDAALRRNGITTYCYAGPETGDEILPQVFEAIQESNLYLVLFSKHYAISSRCHNELKHILQTSETRGQFVVSVYYDVDPAFLREQLAESAVVLSNAASLPTWYSNSIRPESKLIEEIVGDIIKKLNRISPSNDFGDLVGIPDRLNHFKSLLDSDSPKRIIVIEGMDGIGKSTLAKVLFHKFSIQFEASCFIDDVREAWKSGRKKNLQNKIVSGMLGKKVLIIVDDVEEVAQFELLVGHRDRYGSGSRIIITSRNSKAIKDADTVYQMTELSVSEALLLFQLNAFKSNSFTEELIKLSKKVVDSFQKRNPLSLKIMGSSLYGKSSEAWVETMKRLQNVSENEIQNVLRICFDQLEEEEAKNVFLDIACFFKGANKDFTKRILEGCWSCSDTATKDLLDKSLITTRDSKMWMHDILEDLGKKIVKEESVNEPGKRSRLWEPRDVYHVLKNSTGTEAVEAIFLDMSEIEIKNVEATVFRRMDKLRMLKLYSYFANCTLQFSSGDLQFLPNELRYLHWDAYPFTSMPSNFNGNKLVELRMNFSKIEQLWKETQSLGNLKAIDLSFSRKLIAIPDLSRAPNVETVSLRGCKSLVEVPQYFQFLAKLISLDLEDCSSLETVLALPDNIIHVNVARCNSLKSLPSNIYSLKSLRRLDLSGCLSFDSTDYEKKYSMS